MADSSTQTQDPTIDPATGQKLTPAQMLAQVLKLNPSSQNPNSPIPQIPKMQAPETSPIPSEKDFGIAAPTPTTNQPIPKSDFPLSMAGGLADRLKGGISDSPINKSVGDFTGGVAKLDPTGIVPKLLGTQPEGSSATSQIGNLINNILGMGEKVLSNTPVGASVIDPALGQFGKTLFNPNGPGLGNLPGQGGLPGQNTGGFSGQPDTSTGQKPEAMANGGTQSPQEQANQQTTMKDRYLDQQIGSLQMRQAQFSNLMASSPQMAARYKPLLDSIKEQITNFQDERTKQLQIQKDTMAMSQSFGDSTQGTDTWDRAFTDSRIYSKMNTIFPELEKQLKQGDMVAFTSTVNEAISAFQALSKSTISVPLREELNSAVEKIQGLLGSGNVYLPRNALSTMKALNVFAKTTKDDYDNQATISNVDKGSQTYYKFLGGKLDPEDPKNGINRANSNLKGVSDVNSYLDKLTGKKGSLTEESLLKAMEPLYSQVGKASAQMGISKTGGIIKGVLGIGQDETQPKKPPVKSF